MYFLSLVNGKRYLPLWFFTLLTLLVSEVRPRLIVKWKVLLHPFSNKNKNILDKFQNFSYVKENVTLLFSSSRYRTSKVSPKSHHKHKYIVNLFPHILFSHETSTHLPLTSHFMQLFGKLLGTQASLENCKAVVSDVTFLVFLTGAEYSSTSLAALPAVSCWEIQDNPLYFVDFNKEPPNFMPHVMGLKQINQRDVNLEFLFRRQNKSFPVNFGSSSALLFPTPSLFQRRSNRGELKYLKVYNIVKSNTAHTETSCWKVHDVKGTYHSDYFCNSENFQFWEEKWKHSSGLAQPSRLPNFLPL